jgi:DNA repair protein RadA/Sms
MAKQSGVAVFLVGHVTKEGAIAGPKVLEHMVDTVLYLEGERHLSYRLLRATKNRFGSTNELGVFEMQETGLAEVPNASAAFLMERRAGNPGSAVVVTVEGSRPLLVEVQVLVCAAPAFGSPRRSTTGVDYYRAGLVLGVLEKRARIPLAQHDVYVNVPGGVKVTEPAVDLGIAVALASSAKEKPVRADTACFGEVGLTGEVRGVGQPDRRVSEAKRLGFSRCVAPRAGWRSGGPPEGVVVVEDLAGAFQAALES